MLLQHTCRANPSERGLWALLHYMRFSHSRSDLPASMLLRVCLSLRCNRCARSSDEAERVAVRMMQVCCSNKDRCVSLPRFVLRQPMISPRHCPPRSQREPMKSIMRSFLSSLPCGAYGSSQTFEHTAAACCELCIRVHLVRTSLFLPKS